MPKNPQNENKEKVEQKKFNSKIKQNKCTVFLRYTKKESKKHTTQYPYKNNYSQISQQREFQGKLCPFSN